MQGHHNLIIFSIILFSGFSCLCKHLFLSEHLALESDEADDAEDVGESEDVEESEYEDIPEEEETEICRRMVKKMMEYKCSSPFR